MYHPSIDLEAANARCLKQLSALFTAFAVENAVGVEKSVGVQLIETKGAEEGMFTGLASTWQIDLHDDRIRPGAFSKSIRSNPRVPLLWQHRIDEVIGVASDFSEQTDGLTFRGRLAMNTTRGRETYDLLKLGAIDAFSIGFIVPKGGFNRAPTNDGRVIREITEIDLKELSVVTFPANTGARLHPGSLKAL